MGGEIPPRLHWDARDFCSKLSARIMAGKEDMAEEIDDNAVDYGEDDYTGIIPVIRKYMRPGDNDDVRRALEVVVLDRKASTSYLQRRLKIGYNRAAEIMDLFEERGIVGTASGSGENREILIFDSMDE
nr:MAG TPA: Ftsk gamma domain [Caudoviricetes sp.]